LLFKDGKVSTSFIDRAQEKMAAFATFFAEILSSSQQISPNVLGPTERYLAFQFVACRRNAAGSLDRLIATPTSRSTRRQ
jgi:hypothetical protein